MRFSTPELYQESLKGYYRLVTGILVTGADDAIGSLRATLGFAGKSYGHEESLRIPLIIYDPRMAASSRGKRIQAMTLNIDLQPTLLELAGIRAKSPVHGRSATPFLHDPQTAGRSVYYFEHRFPSNGWIRSSEGIRTKRWKYMRYTDVAAPYQELYDLQNDPSEVKNLMGNAEYRRQEEALVRYCATWKQALGAWKPGMAWADPVGEGELRRDGL